MNISSECKVHKQLTPACLFYQNKRG